MQLARLVGAAALAAMALSGCRGDQKAAQAAEVPAVTEEDLAQENDMIARRDALLAARRALTDQREELRARRQEVVAAGGDVTALDAEAQTLLVKERELVSDEQQLNQQLTALLEERRAMISGAGGDQTAAVASREAGLAAREKTLATREEKLAARERALAEREESLASKWKDSCTIGTPTTIVQTIESPKGAKYTKKDVESLLSRARRTMSKKGILSSDLPAPAQGLEKEATKAMAKGDYGQARFAAAQLAGTVKSIKVNKAFVSAKWARLNRIMKGKRLSKDQESLLSGAASNIADGKFGSANRQLNRLFSSAK